jgi:uncharacterized protein (TIGR03437 family)
VGAFITPFAPGQPSGVFQMNVVVPEGVAAGDAQVLVKVRDAVSGSGVTIAV